MSIRVMTWVWEHGPGDQTELLVMLALADFCDDKGRCFPSMARIAEKARLTERGARGVVRRLEASGLVSVKVNGGRGGANEYRVTMQNPEQQTRNAIPGNRFPPERDDTKPGTSLHKTRNHASAEPSGTVKEPSEDPPLVPPSGKATRRRPEVPMPEGWVPSERNIQDAKARQFSDQEIEHEADQFRNYHGSKQSRYRDWDAAWRTWLGNARKFGAGRGVAGGQASFGHGRRSSLASIVARRHAQGQN